MKTNLTGLSAMLLLAASVGLNAEEAGVAPKNASGPRPAPPDPSCAAQCAATKRHSPEFERMKTLVGVWTGKTDLGQGPIDLTVRYRLLAAGSVLEERVFPGTPNEMVTMYYDRDGQLALTHYCVMGNQPAMRLKSSDTKTLTFDFDPICGINPQTESHMHALQITFDDADAITTSCRAFIEGREMPAKPTTLRRVKS